MLSNHLPAKDIYVNINYLGHNGLIDLIFDRIGKDRSLTKDQVRLMIDKQGLIIDIWKYLNRDERLEFLKIINQFQRNNINYRINTSLVRGLHYYNRFVFEVNYRKYTIAGGGRYDGL